MYINAQKSKIMVVSRQDNHWSKCTTLNSRDHTSQQMETAPKKLKDAQYWLTKGCCTGQYLERLKYKNCNESQSDKVNGVGSIPLQSGGMDFEEIVQKQNRSF